MHLLVNVGEIVSGSNVVFGFLNVWDFTPEAEKEDVKRLGCCRFSVVEELGETVEFREERKCYWSIKKSRSK
jgi:hypothetical protein